MVKHSRASAMSKFLTRDRFGQPQVLAGLLLLVLAGQCLWLLTRGSSPLDVDSAQLFRVQEGIRQWRGEGIAGTPAAERLEAPSGPPAEIAENQGYDPEHSPLWYLLASVAFAGSPDRPMIGSVQHWGWLARLPYTVCGVLLGASLWYVARRLYGNAGGFVALSLYCFSPPIIRSSTLWLAEPNMPAAWGTFAAVFTAIAVAHTLYAPREVVLWNWRRTLLLGVSLAIAIGSQFSMIVLVPVALVFLLYVAPVRRRAGLVIWLAACAVGLLVFLSFYFFHLHAFAASMRCADFWDLDWHGLAMLGAYKSIGAEIGRACPALALLAPVALATYAVWPRTRYFGNTAPLVVGALFVALALAHPNAVQGGFLLATVPFLFIFVAGVLADLMQTRYSRPVAACVVALLAVYILRSLIALAHVPRG